jgi:hypothetical protein
MLKEGDIGSVCSRHGGEEAYIQRLVRKLERKKTQGIPGCR